MASRHDGGGDGLVKRVGADQRLQAGIHLSHLAHAAAQHDDVRIQEVDDLRQRARQTIAVALPRLCRPSLALDHGLYDVLRRAVLMGVTQSV